MNNPLELTGRSWRLGRPASGRVLIVGAKRDRRRLALCLGQRPWSALTLVGFVDAGHARYAGRLGQSRQFLVHPQANPVPVLGGVDRLDELVDRAKATHVVVAVSGQPAQRLRPRIAQINKPEVAVHWLTDEDTRADAPAGSNDDLLPWPSLAPQWERVAKRALDISLALLGLIVLTPLFTIVALAIVLTSGRPILYSQERVGRGGRIFRMFKFRSMRRDAEGTTGPIWAHDHDSRCTTVGSWLRRSNIDELPQLINVLRGDMSLVGPRPERPVFVEQFRATVPNYDLRHAVPGGMTGWAQVHGWRGRTSLRKRIQYDLDYIQRWSLGLDFRVLLMTVQHVAWGKISWRGGAPSRRTPHLPRSNRVRRTA
jgi:exopolysaccharide biosynthesis polyprenyl glycosylphosphotransferase